MELRGTLPLDDEYGIPLHSKQKFFHLSNSKAFLFASSDRQAYAYRKKKSEKVLKCIHNWYHDTIHVFQLSFKAHKRTSDTSLNAISAFGCLFLSGWSCNAAARTADISLNEIMQIVDSSQQKRKKKLIIRNLPSLWYRLRMVFTPAFSSTYEKWEPHNTEIHIVQEEPTKLFTNILHQEGRKGEELTPRMWYQSMKEDGLAGFEERSLWTHTTERVEMEQISNTSWVLKSDSAPILPIEATEEGKERFLAENLGRRRGRREKGLRNRE